jgi:hypothetical protein
MTEKIQCGWQPSQESKRRTAEVKPSISDTRCIFNEREE